MGDFTHTGAEGDGGVWGPRDLGDPRRSAGRNETSTRKRLIARMWVPVKQG